MLIDLSTDHSQANIHDVHHFYVHANYCQYTPVWDWLFGWYKPYSDFEKE